MSYDRIDLRKQKKKGVGNGFSISILLLIFGGNMQSIFTFSALKAIFSSVEGSVLSSSHVS